MINQGYQPNKGKLDIKNPPKSGSCLSRKSYVCNCINVKMGSYDNQVVLQRPKHMKGRTEGTSSSTICVDKCIAKEVQYLWSLGMITTGCCCGHNITEGYIGVIDKDIEIMKKGGYKVHHNQCRPKDEDSFIPKSHYENGKLNYLDYPNLYKKRLNK